MRPGGRSSPGRRPRRLPGRGPAAVCRSYPRRTNSARQTGLRFAGLIRVIERAVDSQLLFPFLVARQVRTTSLPWTRRLMGVHDLVRGVARGRSCRFGLVQVEGVHGGVAVQQGEQRPLRDSGHPVGICAGALDAVAAPGGVALAEQVVGRCYGRADPRAMHSTCTVRLPADAGELVQGPRDAIQRDVSPGRSTGSRCDTVASSACSRFVDGRPERRPSDRLSGASAPRSCSNRCVRRRLDARSPRSSPSDDAGGRARE